MSDGHILIVDDLRDIRQLLRFSLETLNLDLNIVDVPSGEEAMLVISRHKFDLLVSDVRLAGISGLELVDKVRRGNPNLKVILITGMTDSEIRQQVAEFGADMYFYKPVDIVEFQAAVVNFLGLGEIQLPEQPVVQAQPASRAISLPDLLSRLRENLGARCVWIADQSGQIILQTGEFPADWEPAKLKAIIAAAVLASADASRSLQRDFPGNYLFFSGMEYDLHAASLGWLYTVLAAIPHMADGTQANAMPRMFQPAVELLAALAEYLPADSHDSIETAADMDADIGSGDRLPVEAVDSDQLDNVIQQAAGQGLDAQEVNEFWDALAEQQSTSESPDSGSLSYEQARKLGLTPDV